MTTKMNKDKFNIQDDEFRVLGAEYTSNNHKYSSPKQSASHSRKTIVIASAIAAIALLLALILFLLPNKQDGVSNEVNQGQSQTPAKDPIGCKTDTLKSYTQHLRDTINDIPLHILIPHNAKPRLCFGPLDLKETSAVLMVYAADIRADNGYPVGAFVIEGNPICGGVAKMGYCAIINGELTLGMAENSPMFEEATKTNGYFFRQFPLVNNGTLIENQARGKSIRKALCVRGEEIFVVITASRESYHDFAEALVDLGVDNAISLVGSSSFAGYKNQEGEATVLYDFKFGTEYENFIIWE